MDKPKKVISLFKTDAFQSRFLNTRTIGTAEDLFVECKSYELVIPVNGKVEKELNIFEEAVIRMIDLKKSSVSELADTLCLEKDFINYILLRLRENRLLDDNQTLSDEGKKMLDRQMNARSKDVSIHGKLFMINKTLILPYIHIGEFHSELVHGFDFKDFKKSTITLGFGSTGSYKKMTGMCVRNEDTGFDSILETNIIRKCIDPYAAS